MNSQIVLPQKKSLAAEVLDPATPMCDLPTEEKKKINKKRKKRKKRKKAHHLYLLCNTTALW